METENKEFYKYSENGIKKRNLKLWEIIKNYTIYLISFKEKFFLYENSLLERPICICGSYLKFIDMRSGYREFCSKRCMYNDIDIKEKRKSTNLIRYGVDNPSKSKVVKDKVKITNNKKFGTDWAIQNINIKEKSIKTNIEKYGVDNPSKVREVREKAENTMFNKYGVKHAMHSEDIKKRIKDYFIEKYGLDNPSKVREVREKAENTMFNKYGVKHALNSNIFLEKLFNTNLLRYGNKSFTRTDKYLKSISSNIFNKNSNIVNNYNYLLIKCDNSEYLIRCNKCNSSFTIQRQLWRNRNSTDSEICLICNPIINGISKGEKMLLSYISSIYDGFIIENYKINKKEIDIYLPELKIGFEFNGLYWHSELNKNKKYHLDKVNFFNTNGIQVTLIWEDDWEYKKDIVKSIILNKLGKSKRIFARKCIIRDVDNRDVRDFLVRNHIQGFVGSKVKLGLYYNNELISLMTFGNLRKSLGQKSYDGSYELLRFCNKLNTSVVGGASKLFSYFIKNYEVKEVISYSDNSRGVGNLYNKLGFKFLYNSVPNYYWCKNGIKYNRFNYRKDKLLRNGGDVNKTEVQIMHDKGHYRIFDCGSGKWLFENLYIQ